MIHHLLFVEDLIPIVYIVSTITVIVLLYALWEGYKRWTYGGQKIKWRPWSSRLKTLTKYALLQWKVLRQRFPGVMHLLIYLGMGWLFLATILRAIDLHIFHDIYGEAFIYGRFFEVYKFLDNIAGLMVLIGSLIAITRRALNLTPNLPKDSTYYAVLVGFIVIVITGFFLDGMASAGSVKLRAPYESPYYDPVGYLVFKWASGLSIQELRAIYRPLWLFHFLFAQLMLALIPFTNLWHIAAATLNVTFARTVPDAQVIKPIEDIDERIEKGETIGIVKLSDTTWKQRMDFDACTSCMRCTNACPAYNSGKILSPRDVIVTLRNIMYKDKWDEEVVGKKKFQIDPEAVWSCVTCGACLYECPVLVHHVDTIIDLRRGMISSASEDIPEDAQNALYNLMQQGNPFGFNPADREEWIQSLAEKFGDDIIAKEEGEYDYLYWIGCVTSYDPRIRPVAENVIAILKKQGFKIGVLLEEGCCGEPARRMGEETLFVDIMKQNLEILSRYRFRKLLVNCPHGYHVFKNEYPRYKKYLESKDDTKELAKVLERLKVEHHSILLSRLIAEGKIRPSKELDLKITYHDPCYLGRWNGVFEEPREVIRSIPGTDFVEMPRNRSRSFCCGGGGGHMFYEIKKGERLATIRAKEAAGTGAKVVAVACPYCNTMLRAEADQFNFEVRDIAELLGESLDVATEKEKTNQ